MLKEFPKMIQVLLKSFKIYHYAIVTNSLIESENAKFINHWKVLGALYSANIITTY